jgi:hypothetical protein
MRDTTGVEPRMGIICTRRLRVRAAVGLVAMAITFRGGGSYSLDRRIGSER